VAGVAGVAAARNARHAALLARVRGEGVCRVPRVAKHAAQGAALVADGLAGGRSAAIVARLGIRDASGSVLDHLHVVTPQAARRRLGID
jgi:predicted butyrate kinase (DUF1464 family)